LVLSTQLDSSKSALNKFALVVYETGIAELTPEACKNLNEAP
jgi:DNA-binding FrmR family transcriptional regulator